MTGREDPAFAALDAHIRAQLTMAAADYRSHADLQALLAAVLESGTQHDDGPAATHS